MKKKFTIALVLLIGFASMAAAHKFYVAIYQLHYAPEKKMLQITARIFVDDLENALKNKYKRTFRLGESDEKPEDAALMQKYLLEKLSVSIDHQPKKLVFVSDELENGVLVCYLKITDVPKINAIGVDNKILFDYVTEQQNIIQIDVNGKKSSMLLTAENPRSEIKFPPAH